MKERLYIILLLKDRQLASKHVKALRKQLFRWGTNPLRTIRALYFEKRHLNNIEKEITAITDAAFFRYRSPLRIEDILNETTNGKSTPKQVPGDRGRSPGEQEI